MGLLDTILMMKMMKDASKAPNQYPVEQTEQEKWLFDTYKGFVEKPSQERQTANAFSSGLVGGMGDLAPKNFQFNSPMMKGQSFAGGIQLPKFGMPQQITGGGARPTTPGGGGQANHPYGATQPSTPIGNAMQPGSDSPFSNPWGDGVAGTNPTDVSKLMSDNPDVVNAVKKYGLATAVGLFGPVAVKIAQYLYGKLSGGEKPVTQKPDDIRDPYHNYQGEWVGGQWKPRELIDTPYGTGSAAGHAADWNRRLTGGGATGASPYGYVDDFQGRVKK